MIRITDVYINTKTGNSIQLQEINTMHIGKKYDGPRSAWTNDLILAIESSLGNIEFNLADVTDIRFEFGDDDREGTYYNVFSIHQPKKEK